ncbi:DoxX family protein [Methyloversatilis thermotolerans]|uniref:DoxX family protein n=1 Tax=Methyloversatilis thermotolerans TaxID=1346290 RepID=UPI00058ED545|nr:DoxX family protein [Methyloversatilis thermotolerans]
MNALHRLRAVTERVAGLADVLQPALLLLLRLYLASVFFKSGLTKIADWDTTLFLFTEEYAVPVLPPPLAAFMGTAGELALPVLLVLGLAGRFAALGLFVVNAVAVLAYPALWGFECPAAIQSHFAWGFGLLLLVGFGPGGWSLDRLLVRRIGAAR